MAYAIVGTEKVTAPAGTNETLKVEGVGCCYNTSVNRSDKKTVTLWYAPEAIAMIRSYQPEWNRGAVNSGGTMVLVSARIMKDSNVIAFGTELSETLPMPDKDAGVRYDPKPAVKWRRPRVRTDELTVQYAQFRFCWTVHEVEMRRHRNLE